MYDNASGKRIDGVYSQLAAKVNGSYGRTKVRGGGRGWAVGDIYSGV